MAGLTTLHQAEPGFTFVKENGVHTLRSSTEHRQKFVVHNDEVYERKVLDRLKYSYFFDKDHVLIEMAKWAESEQGQWVLKNCLDTTVQTYMDHMDIYIHVVISGHVTPKRWTEYCLRFA